VAVESAYDDVYIRTHAAPLAQFKTHLDSQLAMARRLVADTESSKG